MMTRVLGLFGVNDQAENQVAITTKVRCYGSGYESEFESDPSCTESDFEAVSKNIVSPALAYATIRQPNIKIDITLTGKLNGETVNETFHDFDSYIQYLQYSLLIDTKEHPDYVKAIKLLQHLKLVDCPANQDISREMQKMIKRDLLTLPDAIRGLAFYSDIYKPEQRTGEPGINYRNEALHILKEEMPALKDIKLTGTQYGFRPA